MPYDVRNFMKMASMFGQNNALNPTLIPPEMNPLQSSGIGGMAQSPQSPPTMSPDAPPEPSGEPSGQPYPSFNPITRASDRAYDMLDRMPKPEQPGIGRKIGASLVSLGVGPQASERALYGPYHTAMDQWKEEFTPTVAAANQERYYNTNMRSLYDTMIRARNYDARNDIAQQRADTYAQRTEDQGEHLRRVDSLNEWKANNPDGKIDVDNKTGHIIVINPKSGQVIDTGIDSRKVDPIQLENLRAQHAMQRTIQSGQNSLNLEDKRQQGFGPPIQIFMPNGQPMAPYQFNKQGQSKEVPLPEGGILRDKPPGTGSANDTLPLETPDAQRKRWQNNATYWLQQHPEDADFIEFDPSQPEAYPIVKPEGTSSGGSWNPLNWGGGARVLDKQHREEIQRGIFGEGQQQVTRTSKGGMKPAPSHKTETPTAPKAPPGWKYVLKPDGSGWTAIKEQ